MRGRMEKGGRKEEERGKEAGCRQNVTESLSECKNLGPKSSLRKRRLLLPESGGI